MVRMNISDKGIAFIKKLEGCRLTVYKDVAGNETIGHGHLIRNGEDYGKITKEHADEILRDDLLDAENTVIRRVGHLNLTQGMFDALVSFVFNLGGRAFENSTLVEKLDRREFIAAAAEFPRWHNAGGKPVKGLLRRRLAEAELFLS